MQPLVAIGELQWDLRQHQKWPIKQKSLISTPEGQQFVNYVVLLTKQEFLKKVIV